MAKLSDMFNQARRAQSSGGIGFVGKNKPMTKPRAAALVVEIPTIEAGSAESAIKSGADGLLFTWNGKDASSLETLKMAIDAAQTNGENVLCGLHITGGWEKLERENFEHLKELGVNYIVLPLHAPARLLALQIKDLELVVSVPMHEGDMYPIFIRNLTAFDNIAAVRLDFSLAGDVSTMSIEEVLRYRAVREAVRFPSLLNVQGTLSEADAYTLMTLDVQAVILTASDSDATTKKQIKAIREVLEKVHQEDKESMPGLGGKA
jgi:2-methylisocitrate lyase-like PEP mutase family enzyme